ncbi:hypothetical protein F5Y03DRAFT_353877 [Xylaria venustula]|nr:hypothetical protein F5Y03DRAFT_353877 [Xylaria venustula]
MRYRLFMILVPQFTKGGVRKLGEELQHFRNRERKNGGNISLRGFDEVHRGVFVKPPSHNLPRENDHLEGSQW